MDSLHFLCLLWPLDIVWMGKNQLRFTSDSPDEIALGKSLTNLQ